MEFLTRSATFGSPLGERVSLYSMTGRETLGRLFSYEVDLLSQDDSIELSELLGSSAAVIVERTDGTIRQFTGFVTEFALVGEHGNFARYRATLRPWLWFLGQSRNSRIFQRKSVPDIVKDLVREHGFSDVEDLLGVKYEKWEYLVQYRESDLNFVSRMLEHEGIYYYFKHADNKHTLVLADSAAAHKASPGYENVPYFPPLARERRQEEHIDSWILSRQIRQGHITLRDFNYNYPLPFESNKKAKLPEPGSGFEQFDYPAQINAEDADKAVELTTARAEIRLEELQADYETVRGAGPVRGLMAGSKFKLTQYPRDDQNKDHLIVSAAYEIRIGELESNLVKDSEPTFRFQFSAIDAKRPYRSPRITPKPVVEGPQTATIVGEEGQEITTDDLDRVRVQFHWDRVGDFNQDSSCMVRVWQAWAGFGYGAMFIPRRNQEVIVDFLEGDPDRPIITGRVYNKDNPVPYPKNPTQSGFKTHSTPGGGANNFNEIRFEDKKGEEELHFQAEKTMSSLVKKDRSASVGGSDSVSVSGDRSLSVTGNLSVNVKGKGSGPTQSSYDVTGKHSLHASDSISLSAENQISLTVGGTTIVMNKNDITLHTCGTTVRLDFAVDAKSEGGGHLRLDGNAAAEGKDGASMLLSSFARLHSAKGCDLGLDTDLTAHSGAKVLIDGASEAKLFSGGSSVDLVPAKAAIKSAAVDVTASGNATITGALVKINS